MKDAISSENLNLTGTLTCTGSVTSPYYEEIESGTLTCAAGSAWATFRGNFAETPRVTASVLNWSGGSAVSVQTVAVGSALLHIAGAATGSVQWIATGSR